MSNLKEKKLLVLITVFIFVVIASLTAFRSMMTDHKISTIDHKNVRSGQFSEGQLTQTTLIAGPFDIHRRYRSMEGPYILCKVKVADLISSKQLNLPESMVTYTEGGGAAPAMMGQSGGFQLMHGSIDTSSEPRSLVWLKGVKLEVLDENDKVLPSAEFICHWNVDVSRGFRNQVFPQGEWCASSRLITITQGQSQVYFPEGYAVPVASDEEWKFMFQVANRTTDKHRRVKHRCTMYFIKDSDLACTIAALNWYTPIVYVLTDKNCPEACPSDKSNCPSCLARMYGVNAPNNNNPVFKDEAGRVASGHWVIPPGIHRYTTPFGEWADPGFSEKSRTIHAVWSHIHPFCTSLALYKCDANTHQQVFSNSVKTKTKPGIEVESIDYLCSKKGILTDQWGHYELEVTYNNTSGVPQDSMAVAGIFCEDTSFVKPNWALKVKPSSSSATASLASTK